MAIRTDSETGEMMDSLNNYYKNCDITKNMTYNEYDLETGEPDGEYIEYHTPIRKVKFSIPKELINQSLWKDNDNDNCNGKNDNKNKKNKSKCYLKMHPHENYTLSNQEKVIQAKEQTILGCNKTSYRLFLIPSIFLFTQLIASLIMVAEILIHIWSHHKNSRNKNPGIYYRSPLHIISSQFCGICRSQTEMEQVSKLQDRRTKNWRLNFKDVARTIS